MAEEDAEIKIPIKAEADVSGFDETTAAAAEMQDAVEEAASASAPALAEQEAQVKQAAAAKEKEKKASEEAAAAEEKLRRAMELAKKSRNELIKELQRLAKARKEAAVAGDKEAFDQLSAQSAETREAFEKLNQGLELTNIQFVQQAQMGMMAGQTLAGIGQMAAGGASSVAGMAAGFLSLGQAIKAGLGPIGWAMMALQGVQMAWDYFAKKQEEAAKAAKEADEAIAKLNDTLLRHAEAANKARLGALKEYYNAQAKDAQTAADERQAGLERELDAEQAAADKKMELLRAQSDRQKEELSNRLEAGEISKAAYDAEIAELDRFLRAREEDEHRDSVRREAAKLQAEERLQKELLDIHTRAQRRLNSAESDELTKSWSADEEKRYAELVGEYEAQRQVVEARKATIAAINKEMEAEKAGDDSDDVIANLRRRRAEAELEMATAGNRLLELDVEAAEDFQAVMDAAGMNAEAHGLAGVNLLRYARTVNTQLQGADEAIRLAREGVASARARLDNLDKENEHYFSLRGEQAKQREAEKKAAELKEQAAVREEEWGEVQRQSLDEQKAWLEAQLKRMAEGNELWEDYNKRLRSVNDALVGERLSKLKEQRTGRSYTQAEERTQEEVLAADRAILNERLRKLRGELTSGQDLSHTLRKNIEKEIAATERELLGLAQAEVRDRLARLNEKTTTQQYAARDKRTQRQILEADAAILAARRAELRKLLATPGLDDATRVQMEKALRDTQKQISGLKEAWNQNRDASARWLRDLEPPKLQARDGMQRSVTGAARNFAKLAKQAQEAQAAGDTKALERYRKEMRKLADEINEHAKDWNAGTKLYNAVEDALRGCRHELTNLEDAVTMSRDAAQKWFKELTPPKLQAKHKEMQWGLDAAAKSYARVAKQAAAAQAQGDGKALARYRTELNRLAGEMNRRARDAQAGTRLQKQADTALSAMAGQQVAAAQASREATRATQRKAKAETRVANAAEQTARDAKRHDAVIGQLRGELTTMSGAMRRLESEHGRLQAELTSLVGAVTACANAAGNGASAAAQAVSATKGVTARLQGQIKTLQKQVDRLNRKI